MSGGVRNFFSRAKNVSNSSFEVLFLRFKLIANSFFFKWKKEKANKTRHCLRTDLVWKIGTIIAGLQKKKMNTGSEQINFLIIMNK